MIKFGIVDFIDIVAVALLLYYIYKLMKESSSANIFSGILVFIVVWLLVTQLFEMRLLGAFSISWSMWELWRLSFCFKKKYATSSPASAHAAARTLSSACSQKRKTKCLTVRKSYLWSWLA